MKKPLQIDFHSRNDKSGSDFRTNIDQRFPDQIRIAIFMLKSDPEFIFFDRNHDPDQKMIRKKRGSVFMLRSICDFPIKIGSRFFKSLPCQSPPRPKPHAPDSRALVMLLNMTSHFPAGELPFIPARFPCFRVLFLRKSGG
jgi:hypothetical protein